MFRYNQKLIRFKADRYGLQLGLFDRLFLSVEKRGGRDWVIDPVDCAPYPPGQGILDVHVNYIYIHAGMWSAAFAWKSNQCFE